MTDEEAYREYSGRPLDHEDGFSEDECALHHAFFAGIKYARADNTLLSPERVREIARSLISQPWGIGSRWADALDFANAIQSAIKEEHND